MNSKQDFSKGQTPRENFLMLLINKLIHEYKNLLTHLHKKPYKIVEILNLSTIPGETKFAIQLAHKNCILPLSAAELLQNNYNLNDFSDFHAEMISKAGEGRLCEFLRLSEIDPTYKIVGKRFDSALQRHIFTLENKETIRFKRTAEELSQDKNLLSNISKRDNYDVGFTEGSESVLKEKEMLLLAKNKKREL